MPNPNVRHDVMIPALDRKIGQVRPSILKEIGFPATLF
jgi:hypothetical protein